MPYYHALVAFNSSPSSFQCVFLDLDARQLRRRFVSPLSAGREIVVNGRILRRADIASVRIQSTTQAADEVLKALRVSSNEAIDRLNSEPGGVFFVSGGRGHTRDDLCLVGTDVTSEFLPHSIKARSTTVWSNPWLVGIGTAVIAGILLFWLLGSG